jgi:hypothetical protein
MKYLWELQSGECKYPTSRGKSGDHMFCAEVASEKAPSAYCRAHAALCYEKPLGRRQRIQRGETITFVPVKLRHATHDCEI